MRQDELETIQKEKAYIAEIKAKLENKTLLLEDLTKLILHQGKPDVQERNLIRQFRFIIDLMKKGQKIKAISLLDYWLANFHGMNHPLYRWMQK